MKLAAIATVLAIVAGIAAATARADQDADARDEQRIAELLRDMQSANLDALPALPVERFTLPSAGVDVMRCVVEETYEIDGVGTDTIELRGWIAVRHGNPEPAEGQDQVMWGTAVLETEFVGMDLRGVSERFGPVQVHLTPGVRSLGEVGMVAVPEFEESVAVPAAKGKVKAKTRKPQPKPKQKPKPCVSAACNCVAAASANVRMPELGLEMQTANPVLFHSRVETIPPVGYTASVSLIPTALVDNGREVGVLQHAEVKFREIVKHIRLDEDPPAAPRPATDERRSEAGPRDVLDAARAAK